MTKKIFISYRRMDSKWPVACLRQGLAPLLDIEIFMDIEAIRLASDFRDEINDSVDACDALIAVIGPNWLKVHDDNGRRRIDGQDDPVRQEIQRCIDQKKLLIPILFDGAEMPSEEALPEPLKPMAFRQGFSLTFENYRGQLPIFARELQRLGFERRKLDPLVEIELQKIGILQPRWGG